MKEFKFKINGNDYHVSITNIEGTIAELEVNGTPYKVEIDKELKQTKTPKLVRAASVPSTDTHKTLAKTQSPGVATTGSIKSPLPGVILDVHIKPGDMVKRGQKILVLEAMKMEQDIKTNFSGTVKEVFVKAGDTVKKEQALLAIE
jgi:biotin carboxyl carrier protein